MLIRKATINDVTMIQYLNETALGYAVAMSETERILTHILEQSEHAVFIAEVAEQVVGYVHVVEYWSAIGMNVANVMALAVAPSCQRQGIGVELMRAIEEWAHHKNLQGVRLNSGSHRHEAHLFYQAIGYILTKTQASFHKRFE